MSQHCESILSRFRFGRWSDPFMHRPSALMLAAFLAVSCFGNPGYCSENGKPAFQKLFHLVGIPGLRRDQRVNLVPDTDGLLFQTSKVQYRVPYARIHQVLVFPADRRYEGRTYAAALATYGVGSLLILKKHHVDTVVVDYVNERGGKMGIVLQMETSQGEQLSSLLKNHGVSVVEPEDLPQSPLKDETGTNIQGRSNR
jgi:hypothetical protein